MYSQEKFVAHDSEFFIYTPSTTAQKLFFYPTFIGSFQSGFSNESSFCNAFRKWEKKTPSQFRRNEIVSIT